MSVFMWYRLCLCECVHDNLKYNEHIVGLVYGNNSDETFQFWHVVIKYVCSGDSNIQSL